MYEQHSPFSVAPKPTSYPWTMTVEEAQRIRKSLTRAKLASSLAGCLIVLTLGLVVKYCVTGHLDSWEVTSVALLFVAVGGLLLAWFLCSSAAIRPAKEAADNAVAADKAYDAYHRPYAR